MNWSILEGSCQTVLQDTADESVQLIVTSPPYGTQRKDTYGGIHPDKYVDWWMPIAKELWRVLANDGTFILNIKEGVDAGVRHPYVMRLVLAMIEEGWLWTEEFIWHKKTTTPGKWPNRFRDCWEHCFQFNKNRKFQMNQEKVMVEIGDWAAKRIPNLSVADHTRSPSKTGSGFSRNVSKWAGRDKVYPTNVLHLSSETSNRGHSAAFPVSLPLWFIELFPSEEETVLDPFSGSGTTGVAAMSLSRGYLGVELDPEQVERSRLRLQKFEATGSDPSLQELEEAAAKDKAAKKATNEGSDLIGDLFSGG